MSSLLRKIHWQRIHIVRLDEVSCEVQKFIENYASGCNNGFGSHFNICLLKELRIQVLRGKQLNYTLQG